MRPTACNNHAAPPTIAFAQRPITLPAWPAPPVGSPQPWSIVLLLDAPWVRFGTRPLSFDVRTALGPDAGIVRPVSVMHVDDEIEALVRERTGVRTHLREDVSLEEEAGGLP